MYLLRAWLRRLAYSFSSLDRPVRVQRGRLGERWFSRSRGRRRAARNPYCRSASRPFESLEPLTLLSADLWTGKAGDGLWTTSGNWSAGVPTATSDVSITGANAAVPHGSYSVASLNVAADAAIDFTLGGTQAGSDYAVLDVRGAATLDGAVNITFASDYTPGAYDAYQPLLFASATGAPTVNAPSAEAGLLTQTSLYVLRAGFGTLTVTNAADSGSGSLRDAITAADGSTNPVELIDFDIPSTDPGYDGTQGVWTISPASGLRAVTAPTIIDATTQPGYAGKPVIQLTGTNAGSGVDGLDLTGGNSRVSGLAINSFTGDAIHLSGTGDDVLTSNFLGTDATGTRPIANHGSGVELTAVSNDTIGGTVGAARNVVSGNAQRGVAIIGGTGNTVEGNYIGTDVTGRAALPNVYVGVYVAGANNTVGGTVVGTGNLISGNAQSGVYLVGAPASGNTVEGNYIGTDVTGAVALANGQSGVYISGPSNTVGGKIAAARNIISGNAQRGIVISDNAGNTIEGNYIGTNVSGNLPLPNALVGILVTAAGNTIGGTVPGTGNVISGNLQSGVYLDGAAASGNAVEGNYIGTDVTGMVALADGQSGVYISGTNNTVGGTNAAARNVISGNRQWGVAIVGGNGTGNTVEGNYVGTNAAGNSAVANGLSGVYVTTSDNMIGGATVAARNLISGNAQSGVFVYGPSGRGNTIEGNYIGTDATGTVSVANGTGVYVSGPNNTVGGAIAAARNVISGNLTNGIFLDGGPGDVAQGNYIGTDDTGAAALPNGGSGVLIDGTGDVIGGSTAAAQNVISRNTLDGVLIEAYAQNLVDQNSIFSVTVHQRHV